MCPLSAPVADLCVGAGDGLIDRALGLPWAYFYVPDMPAWWVWGYAVGPLSGAGGGRCWPG
jgi:hypothetical protein